MQASDYDTFADVWARAWELYAKQVSPGAIELAYEALQHFEIRAITRALTAHVNDPDTGQFPPKPADVVRLIEGRKEDRAFAAWTKTEGAIRRVGQYATVVFDDPVIHAVIRDMGGWLDLCSTDEEELPFKAREFERRYQGYLIRGGPGDYPRQITGRIDHANQSGGFGEKREAPTLIGDPHRAQQVYAGGGDGSPVQFTRLGDNEQIKLMRELAGTDKSEDAA